MKISQKITVYDLVGIVGIDPRCFPSEIKKERIEINSQSKIVGTGLALRIFCSFLHFAVKRYFRWFYVFFFSCWLYFLFLCIFLNILESISATAMIYLSPWWFECGDSKIRHINSRELYFKFWSTKTLILYRMVCIFITLYRLVYKFQVFLKMGF